jgi:hypothetical protein
LLPAIGTDQSVSLAMWSRLKHCPRALKQNIYQETRAILQAHESAVLVELKKET